MEVNSRHLVPAASPLEKKKVVSKKEAILKL